MKIECTCERSDDKAESRFILDNLENRLEELTALYAGKVQLIYLDPPFATGDQFFFKQRVGEIGYNRSSGNTLNLPAYSDNLPADVYYTFMRNVLQCCHKLLNEQGCIYLHIDQRTSARMRLLLDEVFGESNFLNEIVWHYKSGGRAKTHFSRKHDTIFFYRKSKHLYFDIKAVGAARGKEARNHMRRSVDEQGQVIYTIKSGGKVYTYSEDTPVYPCDVWDDISHLQQKDPERTGYDTQKPEALLNRIILSSSREGDLVADFFSGSGTTASVANKLNRRFLVVDSSAFALHVLRKRLLLRPATLFSPLLSNIELSWNSSLLSPTHNVHFTSKQIHGIVEVTLTDYDAQKADFSQLPHAKAIDFIDYWAVGSVTKDCFWPFAQAFRSAKAGKLPLTLSVPKVKNLALHLVDSFGRQSFFTVELK